MTKQAKIFVLDTNVIIHDYKSFMNFQENDIVIPITVLEELDKFKKGNDQKNYNAREFARMLDKLSGDHLFNGGISMGKDKGKLKIELGHPFTKEMKDSFSEDTPDHRILAITIAVAKANPGRRVALVTKDINFRMKAKSLGIIAEDYLTDRVKDVNQITTKSSKVIKTLTDEQINRFYAEGRLPIKEAKIRPYANQYFILRTKNNSSSALAYYDNQNKTLNKVQKHRAYGIESRNAEQSFALDMLMRPEIQLVGLTGIAGTGKTLLALAAALAQEDAYKQILLARPVIPLQNQEIGFLPGDVKEKIGPYMLPLFDNLAVIKNNFKQTSREYTHIDELLKTEKLLISPLAYIRGRSLSNVFFIIDEAQNLTPHEVKTIITRAGEGTKIVFTGDIHQIDSPYLDISSNGLSTLTEKMEGQDIFAHVNLIKGERSRLAELAGNIL